MNTQTGQIYQFQPNETPQQLAARIGIKAKNLVALGKSPDANCPKCHGTGAIPRGFFSRRFKPCQCTYADRNPGIAAI